MPQIRNEALKNQSFYEKRTEENRSAPLELNNRDFGAVGRNRQKEIRERAG